MSSSCRNTVPSKECKRSTTRRNLHIPDIPPALLSAYTASSSCCYYFLCTLLLPTCHHSRCSGLSQFLPTPSLIALQPSKSCARGRVWELSELILLGWLFPARSQRDTTVLWLICWRALEDGDGESSSEGVRRGWGGGLSTGRQTSTGDNRSTRNPGIV